MQSIKLHWYQTANFGDALSPILVRNLSGREVTYAHPRTADIVGVGSVLFAGSSLFIERTQLFSLFGIGKIMLKAMDAFRQRLNVWGSGFLCNPDVSDVIRIRKVHLCATRGRKSLDVFERAGFISKAETSFVALGDPGLLYYTLLDETPKKEYDLGIVPHYLDAQSGHALGVAFEKIGVQVKVIDVMQSNPLNVIREIM